jgi:MFS family permease
VFVVSGAVQGSWMSRLPAIQQHLHTNYAPLGAALFAVGLGSVLAMAFTGRACRMFGSRAVVVISALVTGVAVMTIAAVSSVGSLAGVLFCYGLASGAWDAAMNVHGSAVAHEAGSHLMQWFHGWWSFGALVGAGLGTLAAHAGIPLNAHFDTVAVVGVLLCLTGTLAFADDREPVPPTPSSGRDPMVLRSLVLLGLLTLCGAAIEGAAGDWIAVFLSGVRQTSDARAASGYFVFGCAMAAGRFAAAAAHERIGGAIPLVRLGAAVAAAGVVLTVLAPRTTVSYVGAVFWGLGISVVFPSALSTTSRYSRPHDAIPVMTMVGYSAGIVTPLLIGLLGQWLGLMYALLLLAPLALVIVVTASRLQTVPAG